MLLLYFNEVDGMNNYAITDHDPQWLFINLTKIVMCEFEANHDVTYAVHHIEQLRNGIVHLELLGRFEIEPSRH